MSRLVLVFLTASLLICISFWRGREDSVTASIPAVTFKGDGGKLSLASSDLDGVVDHFVDLAGIKVIELDKVNVPQVASPPVSIDDLETRVSKAGVKATRIKCAFQQLGPAVLPALMVTRKHHQAVLLLARDTDQQRVYVVTRLGTHGWLSGKEVGAEYSGELISLPQNQMPNGIWIPGHAVGAGILPVKGESKLTFAIFNRSHDQTAKIQGVSSSCGCTSVTKYEREIAPRGMGDVELKINASKSKSKTNFSQQIVFNTSENKLEKMQVFGKLAPSVACSPLYVLRNDIPEDGVDELESFVYCPDPHSTTVSPYAVDPGLIYVGAEPQAELSRLRLTWSLHRGRIETNDKMQFRRGANFLIRYPSPDGSTLETVGTFLVHGTKVTELPVTPRALFAGTLKPGEKWNGEVRILSQNSRGQITVNSSHARDVTAGVSEDGVVKVTVACPMGVTPGLHAANLYLSDSDKCVNLPIMFVAVSGSEQQPTGPKGKR